MLRASSASRVEREAVRQMRKLFWTLSGGLACLGMVPEVLAYCAACQSNLFNSPEGRQLVGGLQQGVAFLLAVPVMIAATVGFLLLRARREQQRCRFHEERSTLPEPLGGGAGGPGQDADPSSLGEGTERRDRRDGLALAREA
jgi:hypothetical protein